MCVSATVIAAASLAVAAVGTAATIDNANYQAKMTELQLIEQQKGLRVQQEMSRLEAQEAESARLAEFRRQRSANLAAMAASDGWGQNMSFLQGIAEAEEKALKTDLSNIRLGQLGQRNRLAGDIRVNRIDSAITRANRNAQVTGAVINGVGQVLQAGQYYQNYNVPKTSGSG